MSCCSEKHILVDNTVDFNVKASAWYYQSKVFPNEHFGDSLLIWSRDFNNSLDILIEDKVIYLSQRVTYIASKEKQKQEGKVKNNTPFVIISINDFMNYLEKLYERAYRLEVF